ncbi:FUSC family membrane protein [Algivirga pacifica]|uniref:YccS family putative transporter n=1 Tax=Algivirga pacifica TaxID=1162670 RepID=A0ABP9D1X5_9BACT
MNRQSAQQFLHTRYFNFGARMALAIAGPLVWCFYQGTLDIGVNIALGVIAIGLSDTAGSFAQKLRGLSFANLYLFLVSVAVGILTPYAVPLLILLFILSFFFGMFALFGGRAANIGNAALIGATFSLSQVNDVTGAFIFSSYMLCGGVWYMLMALFFWRISPYRVAQQTLGASVEEVGKYLILKSTLFGESKFKEQIIRELIDQEVEVARQQQGSRELLLGRRSAIEGTSRVGRALVHILRNTVDIFEASMAKHYSYDELYRFFREYHVLTYYQDLLEHLGSEVQALGQAVSAQKQFVYQKEKTKSLIEALDEAVKRLKGQTLTQENISYFVALNNILRNCKYLHRLVEQTSRYTALEDRDLELETGVMDLSYFLPKSNIGWTRWAMNFNLKSAYFRHSIRLAISVCLGYLLSMLLHLEQGYWVVLTIVVILKPDYSTTKQRSLQRVLGTVIGGVVAIFMMQWNPPEELIIFLVVFTTWGTFSFLSYNYTLGVIFITPFVLWLFYLGNTSSVYLASVRIENSLLGGGIAWLANYFILPNWTHLRLKEFMLLGVQANINYFEAVVNFYSDKESSSEEYKLRRKDVHIHITNLMSAFQGLLKEPSRNKTFTSLTYDFVVINQSLAAHIATLAIYGPRLRGRYQLSILDKLKQEVTDSLQLSLQYLRGDAQGNVLAGERGSQLREFSGEVERLLELRWGELNTGEMPEESVKKKSHDLSLIRDQLRYIFENVEDLLFISQKIGALYENKEPRRN